MIANMNLLSDGIRLCKYFADNVLDNIISMQTISPIAHTNLSWDTIVLTGLKKFAQTWIGT